MRAIIAMTVILHLLWAPTLWLYPAAQGATCVHGLVTLLGTRLTAAIFGGAALLTGAGLWLDARHPSTRSSSLAAIGLMVPQQLTLFAAGGAALSAVSLGAYADGTVIPRAHIFVDQSPYLLLAILHTLAMLWPYLPRTAWAR